MTELAAELRMQAASLEECLRQLTSPAWVARWHAAQHRQLVAECRERIELARGFVQDFEAGIVWDAEGCHKARLFSLDNQDLIDRFMAVFAQAAVRQ